MKLQRAFNVILWRRNGTRCDPGKLQKKTCAKVRVFSVGDASSPPRHLVSEEAVGQWPKPLVFTNAGQVKVDVEILTRCLNVFKLHGRFSLPRRQMQPSHAHAQTDASVRLQIWETQTRMEVLRGTWFFHVENSQPTAQKSGVFASTAMSGCQLS